MVLLLLRSRNPVRHGLKCDDRQSLCGPGVQNAYSLRFLWFRSALDCPLTSGMVAERISAAVQFPPRNIFIEGLRQSRGLGLAAFPLFPISRPSFKSRWTKADVIDRWSYMFMAYTDLNLGSQVQAQAEHAQIALIYLPQVICVVSRRRV